MVVSGFECKLVIINIYMKEFNGIYWLGKEKNIYEINLGLVC